MDEHSRQFDLLTFKFIRLETNVQRDILFRLAFKYDLVVFHETQSMTENSLASLLDPLTRIFPQHKYELFCHQDNGGHMENSALLYRQDKFEVDRLTAPKNDYIAVNFKPINGFYTALTSFVILVIHTSCSDVTNELVKIENIVKHLEENQQTKNILVINHVSDKIRWMEQLPDHGENDHSLLKWVPSIVPTNKWDAIDGPCDQIAVIDKTLENAVNIVEGWKIIEYIETNIQEAMESFAACTPLRIIIDMGQFESRELCAPPQIHSTTVFNSRQFEDPMAGVVKSEGIGERPLHSENLPHQIRGAAFFNSRQSEDPMAGIITSEGVDQCPPRSKNLASTWNREGVLSDSSSHTLKEIMIAQCQRDKVMPAPLEFPFEEYNTIAQPEEESIVPVSVGSPSECVRETKKSRGCGTVCSNM